MNRTYHGLREIGAATWDIYREGHYWVAERGPEECFRSTTYTGLVSQIESACECGDAWEAAVEQWTEDE
jgi:hypothetical protein